MRQQIPILLSAILVVVMLATACGAREAGPAAAPADSTAAPPATSPRSDADANRELVENWWILEYDQLQEKLKKGQTVEIRNPYGDINIRRQKGTDEVLVKATIQRHKADPDDEQIKLLEKNGRLLIEVLIPTGTQGAPASGERPKRRIDLGVAMPNDRLLVVQTDEGLIRTKSAPGPIRASSKSGDISASVGGQGVINSESGNIRVRMLCNGGTPPLSAESQSGSVTLFVTAGCGGRIQFTAGGQLDTAYPVKVDEVEGAKRGMIMLDEQQLTAQLLSAKGDVRIERPPEWAQICDTETKRCEQPGQTQAPAKPVEPAVFSGSLNDLPPAQAWKPGDPMRVDPPGDRITR